MARYFVYMLANQPRGSIYTGVTRDLAKRIWEHREGAASAHTRKYAITALVWFEGHDDVLEAIAREKRIKRWRRAWKLGLVEQMNPGWKDLYFEIAR